MRILNTDYNTWSRIGKTTYSIFNDKRGKSEVLKAILNKSFLFFLNCPRRRETKKPFLWRIYFSKIFFWLVFLCQWLGRRGGGGPDQDWKSWRRCKYQIFYATVEDITHFTKQGWFYSFLARSDVWNLHHPGGIKGPFRILEMAPFSDFQGLIS